MQNSNDLMRARFPLGPEWQGFAPGASKGVEVHSFLNDVHSFLNFVGCCRVSTTLELLLSHFGTRAPQVRAAVYKEMSLLPADPTPPGLQFWGPRGLAS